MSFDFRLSWYAVSLKQRVHAGILDTHTQTEIGGIVGIETEIGGGREIAWSSSKAKVVETQPLLFLLASNPGTFPQAPTY